MIGEIVKYLQLGKVVIFPTETVYALAASAVNFCAIERIYHIKQRNRRKFLPLMFYNIDALLPFTDISAWQERVIRQIAPGPITFIIRRNMNCSLKRHYPKKIAVRIPDCQITSRILSCFKRPIVATSLNLSNQKSIRVINNYFKEKVSKFIHHQDNFTNRPSAIIDISDDVVKIIRSGDFYLENAHYFRNLQRQKNSSR